MRNSRRATAWWPPLRYAAGRRFGEPIFEVHEMDTILTVDEVAHYLHCHMSTIYRLLKHGWIPAFRVGSDWRFNLNTRLTAGGWRALQSNQIERSLPFRKSRLRSHQS
jgi:excisionase family DNA binding protein